MKLKILAKCSDMCRIKLIDDNGRLIVEKDGYVPSIEGIGKSDYIEMAIDVESGKVIGFSKESIASLLDSD